MESRQWMGNLIKSALLTVLMVNIWLVFSNRLPVWAAATIHYVATSGNCGSVNPCYATIQSAVDAAADGDEIRVAAGTYSGVNSQGGTSQVVYVAKNLTLRGGFTTTNWTTPDPVMNSTEINAQTLGRVVRVAEAAILTMSGFDISYGNATGLAGYGSNDAGGGIYVDHGTLTLDTCRVLHSFTPPGGRGGGLYAGNSNVTLIDTHFEDNGSDHGGGAHLYQSTSVIRDSTFKANRVFSLGSSGQGLTAIEGTLRMSGSTIDANINQAGATYDGSVHIEDAGFTLTENTITGTTGGTRYGSGIYILYSSGTLSNNYIASNRNKGVGIQGGYVSMSGNEVAYNEGRAPSAGSGVTFIPDPLNASEFNMTNNNIHHNTDNYGTAAGGGVNISTRVDNPATLSYNLIQDNVSADGSVLSEDGDGGGVYVSGDYVTLVGNVIQRNFARGYLAANTSQYGGHGGGVYINGNAMLINNIITDNKARFAGSGVFVSGSAPYLYHNTIANNVYSASEDGSGVYAAESFTNVPGQPRLYNTIISGQNVGVYAFKEDVSSVVFVENILWYDNDQNTGGGGTTFVNSPHPGDPKYADSGSYDYHIQPGSAAIDQGAPTDVLIDIDRQPRFNPPDLGADEYWAPGSFTGLYLPILVR